MGGVYGGRGEGQYLEGRADEWLLSFRLTSSQASVMGVLRTRVAVFEAFVLSVSAAVPFGR